MAIVNAAIYGNICTSVFPYSKLTTKPREIKSNLLLKYNLPVDVDIEVRNNLQKLSEIIIFFFYKDGFLVYGCVC